MKPRSPLASYALKVFQHEAESALTSVVRVVVKLAYDPRHAWFE